MPDGRARIEDRPPREAARSVKRRRGSIPGSATRRAPPIGVWENPRSSRLPDTARSHDEGDVPMISAPKLEDRDEQPYAGIRTQVPMHEFPRVIPQFLGEVITYLRRQGIAPA